MHACVSQKLSSYVFAIIAIVVCIVCMASTANAASLPSDCTLTATPESSPTNVLVAGTSVTLTASCAGGDAPIKYVWGEGCGYYFISSCIRPSSITVKPVTTTSYAMLPTNAVGGGIPVWITIYIGTTPTGSLLQPPANCTVAQEPNTQFDPPPVGTPITLQVSCASGNAPTGCYWAGSPVATSCQVEVPMSGTTSPISVTPFNSAGSSLAVNTTVYAPGDVHFDANALVVGRRNITMNGARLKLPTFVGAGDSITFDAVLVAAPLSTGLGLCLEYPRALGNISIGNVATTDYIGAVPPVSQAAPNCTAAGTVNIQGADQVLITPWTEIFGKWPKAPFPVKLYDAQLAADASPSVVAYVGFAATSVGSGRSLLLEPPLIVCAKPRVIVTRTVTAATDAVINVLLSTPIPQACGKDGILPMKLAVDPSLATASINGNGASLTAGVIDIAVPADGVTTAIPIAIHFDRAVSSSAILAGIHLVTAGQNYTNAGDAVPAAAVPAFSNGVGGSTGGAGTGASTNPPSTINVAIAGRTGGSVAGNPGNIACPGACDAHYASGTPVTLTAIPDAGSQFAGWLGDCTGRDPCTLTVTRPMSVTALFAPSSTQLNLDIDSNARIDALTDGLLVARYLQGLRTTALTDGVLPSITTTLLERFIDLYPLLDIDGNGRVEALTDGLLLQRYLFGLRGEALLRNAIGQNARRTTSADIEQYIQSLSR